MTFCSCTLGSPTGGCGRRRSAALESAGHRVVAPDLPGIRRRAARARDVDYVGFAAKQLDGHATVVGCSFGGRVALELAAARPDLVERLVLVARGS